jgi:hypothetical protein
MASPTSTAAAALAGAALYLWLRLRSRAPPPPADPFSTASPASTVIVSCRELVAAGAGASSSWAVAGLDELALYSALRAAGVPFHIRAWDDPAVHWPAYSQAIVRTTWDYSKSEASAFAFTQWLAGLARARATTRVLNHERILADGKS